MTRKWRRWLFLLIPCLPVLATWNQFIVPAGTSVSDVLISHYPNLLFLQHSLAEGQGIPLWSPLILSGYPLAANPLSSLWYPPAWISLAFPLPLGINLVMASHIWLGCLGMYRLLRNLELSEGVSLIGGVFYGFLPAGYSHVISGHFTWVCASAWLPWLLLGGLQRGGWHRRDIGRSAFFLGMMLLADMRFAAYGAALWLGMAVYLTLNQIFTKEKGLDLHLSGGILFSLILAGGISAVVWFPLQEYTGLSTRSLMTPFDSLYLSLPAVHLTGLIVPGQPKSMEWIIFPGAACLILLLGCLPSICKRKDMLFWLIAGLVSFLWSLGEIVPVNRWLVSLPGFDLLRVPARGMIFAGFCLMIIGMRVLDNLVRENPPKPVFFRLGILFFTLFTLIIQVFIIIANSQKNISLIWNSTIWVLTAGLLLSYSYRKIPGDKLVLVLGALMVFDLGIVDMNLMSRISIQSALNLDRPEFQFLAVNAKNSRVFSPSYSITQQTAAAMNLELADGIDPLQLLSYSRFMGRATGLETDAYSVTLPPFRNGDPFKDNTGIKPDAHKLGLLNVAYLVSAFPVEAEGWSEIRHTDSTWIYKNSLARGWAWVESGQSEDSNEYNEVKSIIRSSNRIMVTADGPGNLVLSEIIYPGWQAWVDGNPVTIETAYDLLRSIPLSSGTHNIEFKFFPDRVYLGVCISLMSLLLCILIYRVRTTHDT